MSACKRLGYNVGDKFIVVDESGEMFPQNTIVTLHLDDGSESPLFSGSGCKYNIVAGGGAYMNLRRVKKIDDFDGNI